MQYFGSRVLERLGVIYLTIMALGLPRTAFSGACKSQEPGRESWSMWRSSLTSNR